MSYIQADVNATISPANIFGTSVAHVRPVGICSSLVWVQMSKTVNKTLV